MIRPATADDLPRIVAMGLRFLGDVYAAKMAAPDPERMAQTVDWLLSSDERALFVAEKDGGLTGMIGLFLYQHPMSGERTASEMFWWVEPEHRGTGLRLLNRARAWAKDAGATTLQMIAPTADVEVLYARLGFTRIEVAYARAL